MLFICQDHHVISDLSEVAYYEQLVQKNPQKGSLLWNIGSKNHVTYFTCRHHMGKFCDLSIRQLYW